jgi:hypothetical protein
MPFERQQSLNARLPPMGWTTGACQKKRVKAGNRVLRPPSPGSNGQTSTLGLQYGFALNAHTLKRVKNIDADVARVLRNRLSNNSLLPGWPAGAVSLTLNFLRFGAALATKLGECLRKQSRSNGTGSRPM